jgi:hypothetical protein
VPFLDRRGRGNVVSDRFDPAASEHFRAWEDPNSGVTSYLLETAAAEWTASLYFTNDAVGGDGRYWWFQAIHPPSPRPVLGRYDAVADDICIFPAMQTDNGGPHVDPETGGVYCQSGRSIYRRGPERSADVELVGRVTDAAVGGHPVQDVSTHLTASPGGTRLGLDIEATYSWHVGTMDVETGEVDIWWSTDECKYNHAQFSPTREELLVAQDYWTDAEGNRHPYDQRMWLVRPDGERQQVGGEMPMRDHDQWPCRWGHEWWADDGDGVWYVDYEEGTHYWDRDDESQSLVWPGGRWHSHASSDGRWLVGDNQNPRNVLFHDRDADRDVAIVSDLPPETDEMSRYHVHPHPHFERDDEFVTYTTTVDGSVAMAVTPTDQLVDRPS